MDPQQPSQHNDIVLFRYTVKLQKDGQLASHVENLNPEEFLKEVDKVDKEWDGGPAVASAIKFLLGELRAVDENLERHLMSI